MVNAATPWTVRTTKRRLPAAAQNPRKRHQTINHVADSLSSVGRNPRQQTLTQLQFVPHQPQDDLDDNLVVTAPGRASEKKHGVRLRKGNSTLTQMDFVARFAVGDEQKEEWAPLQDGGDIEDDGRTLVQLDGTSDARNPRRQGGTPLVGRHTSKRKAVPAASEASQEYLPIPKKLKSDNDVKEDDAEPGRRTSRRLASVKAARSIGLLSAIIGDDYDEILERSERPSIRSNAPASRVRGRRTLPQELSEPLSDQENKLLSLREIRRTTFPRTPSKENNVIPSSQSPESLSPSTWRKGQSGSHRILSKHRSPLKERSINERLISQRHNGKEPSCNRPQAQCLPKRKIFVLKLPNSHLRPERISTEIHKTASKHSIGGAPSSGPKGEESGIAPATPVLEIKDRTEISKAKALSQKPPKALAPYVYDSVEPRLPDGPGTNPPEHQQAPITGPGPAADTHETLPNLGGLLGLSDPPLLDEAIALQESQEHYEREKPDIVVQDLAVSEGLWRARQTSQTNLDQDEPLPVGSPGVSSVADPEEAASVLDLSPGSSIANDTQFNADLAERILISSADASPSPLVTPTRHTSPSPSLQLDREFDLSLPRPKLIQQQSTYSTTKTVPLNDTSSPSLPSRSTQCTVYPASLPRPSQVSTQDPTQPYFPMSSIPLQSLSSPVMSGPATITIKDSSSVTRPVRDIPSQRQSQSQSQLNIDLGLDDCLDLEYDEELDQGLLAMSDEAERGLDEEGEESQIVPVLPDALQDVSPAKTHTWTTESGSPVRRRRPRKPIIPPEVLALLGESFLESVPGPPGWSQQSWDDEPL